MLAYNAQEDLIKYFYVSDAKDSRTTPSKTTPSKATPTKMGTDKLQRLARRMSFDNDSENRSPMKSCTVSQPSPLVASSSNLNRLALSPRKDLNIASSSPRSNSINSPKRHLFTSPVKRNLLQSPSKSGVASLGSPIKRTGIMSPVKCGSPVKRVGIESPRKISQSPSLRLARQEGVCYQKAKQALHTALPDRLLCREKEYKEVNDFLDYHLSKKRPGSMYISGAPGTGKTAVLSKTLNRIQVKKGISDSSCLWR